MSLTQEEIARIQELAGQGMALRAIARRLGRNIKTIRAVLNRPQRPPRPGKLEPFRDLIRELAAQRLTATRILREIRSRGYSGSLTILKQFLRSVRGTHKPPRKVFRRFETRPGAEAQVDWSAYRVPIAGRQTVVHCFSMIAAYSRQQFIAFYRDERLTTLLHAHAEAFRFFGGVFRTVLYDNMTAVTLGRSRGRPIWNPTFLKFARHYGFEPRVCRPRDPNRRGKVERPFAYIDADFLRGQSFASWADLNERGAQWLNTVANVRVHATTRKVPREAFSTTERPVLIRLPAVGLDIDRREVRKVYSDGTVAVDGSFYPVPAPVGAHVTVLVDPHRVRVLDAKGQVIATHAIPDRPMRRPAPPPAAGAAPDPQTASALEVRFRTRFPESTEFLQGLHKRMNALLPIHLRKIEKLTLLYGHDAVRQAIGRAQHYRNFSAVAIERILQAAHPNGVDPPPPEPIAADPAALGALDDVDSGAPEDYTLDGLPPTDTEDEDAGPQA
ncbi:MAG: IS21 family transposase [Phycisphaerae bacterium]